MKGIKKYPPGVLQTPEQTEKPSNPIFLIFAILNANAIALLLIGLILDIQKSLVPENAILSNSTAPGIIPALTPVFIISSLAGVITAGFYSRHIYPAGKIPGEKTVKKSTGAPRAYTRSTSICAPFPSCSHPPPYSGDIHANGIKNKVIFMLMIFPFVTSVYAMAVTNYFYVTEQGIYTNPLLSIKRKHYGWEDIKRINIHCDARHENLILNYLLEMADGSQIDLLNGPRLEFAGAYDRIKPFIEAQKDIVYTHDITNRGVYRLRQLYSQQNANSILKALLDKYTVTLANPG